MGQSCWDEMGDRQGVFEIGTVISRGGGGVQGDIKISPTGERAGRGRVEIPIRD